MFYIFLDIPLWYTGFDTIEYIKIACYLILFSTILDSIDGKIARKLNITSEFGKEIDSLADLVSFCIAPSLLLFIQYIIVNPSDGNILILLIVGRPKGTVIKDLSMEPICRYLKKKIKISSLRSTLSDTVFFKLGIMKRNIPLFKSALSRHSLKDLKYLLNRAYYLDKVLKGVNKGNPWCELKQLILCTFNNDLY